MAGAEGSGPARLYLQDFPDGAPRPARRAALASPPLTAAWPCGRTGARWPQWARLARAAPALPARRRPGARPPVPGTAPSDVPVRFTPDGRFVWVFQPRDLPTWIVRIDRTTGARERWKEIQPPDPAGILGITRVRMTPDGRSYAYTFSRILSDLFLATGLL